MKRKGPMKIFLDCSDPELLKPAVETGLIDGVTTNPTLMKKQGMEPLDVIQKICELFFLQRFVHISGIYNI